MNKKDMRTYKQTAFRFSPETEKQLLKLTLIESITKNKQVPKVDIIRDLIKNAYKKLDN